MDDDVLVRVENVSKRFCRSLKRSLWYGLQDLGSELGGRRHCGGQGLPQSSADVQLRQDEFWAVKDVSFELRRGECLGLIGRNGAGKTTLLRILNGLIKPDTGRIEMRGRVGGLIALGAGFNPVLTGRENIYVSAGILGLTQKQIESKLQEIVDFSGIPEFIDTPVQSYSAGMQVRLGFAIATAADPDILLIDEVLAVGDAGFASKCMNKIAEIRSDAVIIFVSHSMPMVARVCSSILVMRGKGHRSHLDSPRKGIERYYSLFGSTDARPVFDDRLFRSVSLKVCSLNKKAMSKLKHGDRALFEIYVVCAEMLEEILVSISILDLSMTELIAFKDRRFMPIEIARSQHETSIFRAWLASAPLMLNAGNYKLAISIETESKESGIRTIHYQNNHASELIFTSGAPSSAIMIHTLSPLDQ